jgi:hypothetical protein
MVSPMAELCNFPAAESFNKTNLALNRDSIGRTAVLCINGQDKVVEFKETDNQDPDFLLLKSEAETFFE